MAASARFESASASSSEAYANGKRGSSTSLDRSASFRSGSLAQFLSLEPITIGDRKIDRSGELKRVMGLIVASTAEDDALSSPVVDDLKRLRSSVADTCNTARGRASKLDENLHKLDKYCDGVIPKKPQRIEIVNSDQAGALNSKTGTQIYRNPTELVNQRVEDRPKNVLLNKRVRTSVAETRADLRSNGTVFTRPVDSNGEPKRTVQSKAVSEPGLPSNDAHPYRLGASNGIGGTQKLDNKLEGPPLPNSSRIRLSPKNELEGPIRELAAGSNKERILTKGNNKSNTRDDDYSPSSSQVTKGKATRTTRNGATLAASSLPSTPRLSGTPETWENLTATGGTKIPSTGGVNNRKRAMPSGPSPPSVAKWVGQRPQKISRTRRSNLVSPVSNQEEKPLSSDSCSHSDISARLAPDGTTNGPISKPLKPILEPVQSPHRMSESEESVGGESRLKDKKVNIDVDGNDSKTVGPSVAIGMKVKSLLSEESGEAVKRQGRTGRGPLIARASSSLNVEKLDDAATVKPLKSNRPGSEKNGSKMGRPVKKLTDRKGISRLGNLQNNGSESTGHTGKSDDDREDLMAAANYARNASYLACSSPFWKKMEPIFAPIKQDVEENFPRMHGRENNVVVNFPQDACAERFGHVKHQGSESFSGRLDSEKTKKEFIPLFQRVLSALIIEDTFDELEEEDTGNIPLDDAFCDSTYDTFQPDNYDPRKRARMEVEHETVFQSIHSVKVSFSSNGCINSFGNSTIKDSPCDAVPLAGISKNLLNRPQVIQMEGFGISSFDNQYEQMRLDDKLLLELHSIGLYPDIVPKLDDKDEAIKNEINQLRIKLRQQNYKKKACLEKISKGVGGISVGRNLEQVALDRLVELAYRKLLATKVPRGAIQKIPKHVALAFARRTLSKCRKFGKSGVSCFSMPPLRDILFAPPEYDLDTSTSVGMADANTTTKYIGFQNPHPDSRISSDEAFAINGPISNRGKKKELSLDDVGTVFGGTMGKRAYLGGNRKLQPTPKQKVGQPLVNQFSRTLHPVQPSLNGPNYSSVDTRREIRTVSHGNGNGPQEVPKAGVEIIDPLLDPIDELGVGGPQDLNSLLNFDDTDDLQDHFSAGLEIPMDDLTELNMF
uniref:Uncharacterized protein n=1 Tax=Tanacetum cinerariifolium TaxID=118510 RepID=A0A6L2JTB4_TANCI|nr:hypothetical protein [Tanacetum cinerariifolium]